ncbi:GntR family transcriptional regulator [Streptomyces sp. NPDC006971]|uniref:GntR family transcriptional regulator n=1 Tax=Streptomyces sp. NPDC006971 TaxID=3154784 RepID=UPI0033C72CDB
MASPRWKQLADEIAGEIAQGVYPPGSKLPKIADLVAAGRGSRTTIQRAYSELTERGLTIGIQKLGTVVSPILGKIHRDGTGRYMQVAREQNGARGAFGAEIERLGMTPGSTPTVSRGKPPAHVAALLGVENDLQEPVLIRTRVMTANEIVVQLATSYFPGDIAFGSQLEQQDTGPGGSKSRLEELGHGQRTITETINVRSPSAEEASTLAIPAERQVYEITHVARSTEGRAVEVCVHVVSTTLWTLTYTWPIDPPDAASDPA